MMTTTNRRSATANPPPRRRYSRWRTQSGLSRVAQASAANTLGHLVDISRGGFQISLPQPVSPVEPTELLLILDQYPDAPQMTTVKATQAWMDADRNTGLWCAGFRIDDLQPKTAMGILLHIKTHKTDYAVIPADSERTVQPLTQANAFMPTSAATSPSALYHESPISVAVFGFSKRERHLLDNIITLSTLRAPGSGNADRTYRLHPPDARAVADVVLVDVDDPNAINACSAYLMNKPLIRTIKMSSKPHVGTDPHIIPRRFVPRRILEVLDSACRESAG